MLVGYATISNYSIKRDHWENRLYASCKCRIKQRRRDFSTLTSLIMLRSDSSSLTPRESVLFLGDPALSNAPECIFLVAYDTQKNMNTVLKKTRLNEGSQHTRVMFCVVWMKISRQNELAPWLWGKVNKTVTWAEPVCLCVAFRVERFLSQDNFRSQKASRYLPLKHEHVTVT